MILSELPADELRHALVFAAIVLGVVIGVRFLWVMTYGAVVRFLQWFFDSRTMGGAPITRTRIGVLVSWCGMRGLVTLATAFSLPPDFPGRNVIVLSAFTVVLGTLVVQGFTIRPLIALLRIAPDQSLDLEVAEARRAMLDAALAELAGYSGEAADAVPGEYGAARAASSRDPTRPFTQYA